MQLKLSQEFQLIKSMKEIYIFWHQLLQMGLKIIDELAIFVSISIKKSPHQDLKCLSKMCTLFGIYVGLSTVVFLLLRLLLRIHPSYVVFLAQNIFFRTVINYFSVSRLPLKNGWLFLAI